MKKIFSLALLFLLIISLCASLCACFAYVPDDDSDDSKPPVNYPEDNQDENGEKENTNETEDSAVQGGNSDTDGDNTTSSPSGEGSTATGVGNGGSSSATKPTEPEEKYSQILKNIFESEYYDNLIARAQNDGSLYSTGYFEPHPYAFLEKQGHDISAIKNDNVEAETFSYVLDNEPNSLYMYTKVMQNNSYWQTYLLKYEITDQEYKDYKVLHAGEKGYKYFVQSVFINDEISRTRDAEIVGTSKVTPGVLESMSNILNNERLVDSSDCNLIFINPDQSNRTYDVIVLPTSYNNKQMHYATHIVSRNYNGRITVDGDVVIGHSSNMTITNEQTLNANVFLPQEETLNSIYCPNYEYVK